MKGLSLPTTSIALLARLRRFYVARDVLRLDLAQFMNDQSR
jgi:hypothetical protein